MPHYRYQPSYDVPDNENPAFIAAKEQFLTADVNSLIHAMQTSEPVPVRYAAALELRYSDKLKNLKPTDVSKLVPEFREILKYEDNEHVYWEIMKLCADSVKKYMPTASDISEFRVLLREVANDNSVAVDAALKRELAQPCSTMKILSPFGWMHCYRIA